MSPVVDRRASLVARGGRRGSFQPPAKKPPPGGPAGAFRSHSCRTLGGTERRRGLTTEAAREVCASLRNLGGTARSEPGRLDERDAKQGKRRSSLGGVSYGRAAVRRVASSSDDWGGGTDDSADGGGGGVRRRRSVGAGEGAWLVRQRSKESKRRQRSRNLVRPAAGESQETFEKEASEESPPLGPLGAPEEAKGTTTAGGLLDLSYNGPEGGSGKGKGNHVQFATVSVRYYPIVPGFNPSVTSGPPLEIAWGHDFSANESMPVDRFEDLRGPLRRSEWDLALSRGERESKLLEAGYTREEIATAVRETSRIKAQRAQTVLNLRMAGAEEFAEDVRRRSAKAVGLRKSSDWLYQDWKKKGAYGRHAQFTEAPLGGQNSYDAGTAGGGGRPVGGALPPSPRDSVRSGGGAGAATCGGQDVASRSPLRRAVRKALGRRDEPPTPGTDAAAFDDAPRGEADFQGPAFGIARRSLSSRGAWFDVAGSDEEGGDGGRRGGGGGDLWPFAEIKVVWPHSPAEDAGLTRGDKIVRIGNVAAFNHDHCRAVPALGQVAAAKEHSLPMVVEDARGERRTATIRPGKWEGRGHFGFLLRELGE